MSEASSLPRWNLGPRQCVGSLEKKGEQESGKSCQLVSLEAHTWLPCLARKRMIQHMSLSQSQPNTEINAPTLTDEPPSCIASEVV